MADIINNIVGGRYYILELIGRGGSAIGKGYSQWWNLCS